MNSIDVHSQEQLFTQARTCQYFLPQAVEDQTLRAAYDLMKWGPTSANLCPGRIVFVKSGPEKEKLLSCLMPLNVEKVKTAPVTAIIAYDEKFYDQVEKLFPMRVQMRDMYAGNKALADATAFRNGSLQGAYFILAARAVGLDCGPMSGFDNAKVDQAFFEGTSWKSNFICNLGHGDKSKVMPRLPRLSFEDACKII